MTPEVWIALFGLIGTLGAGLGATWLNNKSASEREELRWNREIEEQRRVERLDTFEESAALTMMVVDQGDQFSDTERLMRSLHRLEMRVSRATGDTARKLYLACSSLARENGKPGAGKDVEESERLARNIIELREEFIGLARAEADTPEIEAVSGPTVGPH